MGGSLSVAGVPGVAARQGGVFTAQQARAEGWTARTVRRRITARRWVYVAGRALAEPRPRWTHFQLAIAAELSMRDVVISHRTAAGLYTFPVPEPDEQLPECDVILGTHRQAGLRINAHLVRLAESDVQIGPCGLRVTTPARTALDCLATLPFGAALDLWAWLATRRVLDGETLTAAIDDRRGRHGTPQLRRIAAAVADGAFSHTEFRMHELLRDAGLTGWTANVPVRDDRGPIGVVDVLFAEAKVIVEVDGWGAHRSRTAFDVDRRRQNRLVAAGYTVLRVTWTDLTTRPARVIAEVRQVLGLGG